jgi:hypothetical protein
MVDSLNEESAIRVDRKDALIIKEKEIASSM